MTDKTYFATLSTNQSFNGSLGPGYVEITAESEKEARDKIQHATSGRWSFMYHSLEAVHPLDQIKLGDL